MSQLRTTIDPMEEEEEEDDDHKAELQLLPTPHYSAVFASSSSSSSSGHVLPAIATAISHRSDHSHYPYDHTAPSLDLQLSISLRPIHHTSPEECHPIPVPFPNYAGPESGSIKALKWHAAEQIRLAAIEKAYAERVRELTRREMELAQSEFARARNMWERAREEANKAEKMKERATRRIDSSTCLEITCQSCRQSFRP